MNVDSVSNMGPVNAAVRFVCEIAAVYGIAAGVWTWTDSVVATVVAPVMAMVAWSALRVPGDPGPAPIAVAGFVRLVIEAVVFGVGIAGVWAATGAVPAIVFSVIVVLHYRDDSASSSLPAVLAPLRAWAPDGAHRTAIDRCRFIIGETVRHGIAASRAARSASSSGRCCTTQRIRRALGLALGLGDSESLVLALCRLRVLRAQRP